MIRFLCMAALSFVAMMMLGMAAAVVFVIVTGGEAWQAVSLIPITALGYLALRGLWLEYDR